MTFAALLKVHGVFVPIFRYSTLECCSGFYGNGSLKTRIAWKYFDLCNQILVATMAICYADIIMDTFPLKPLFHIQGYHGNHYCNTPGC